MNPKDRAGAKKPNLSVLPFAPLLDVIPALYEGRRKYGPWNWRAEEVSETIYADAAIRHLMQFIAGEDIDPDSGVHHISKAIAGLLVVRDAQIHGCSIDDRYVNQDLQIDKQIAQLAGVNERYPEPVPSDLPPRDHGITGGETMTPEDAEKIAEYYGLREALESREGVEQVEHFDPDRVHIGDIVAFANGDTSEITDIDIECPQGLIFLVGDEDDAFHTYYRVDGTAEDPVDTRDLAGDGYERIVTIGNQTLLHFELKNPTCGLAVKTDGGIYRWSSTVAASGSYKIKPEDVGKEVELRNGVKGRIALISDSLWPFTISVDGQEYTTVTENGQASSNTAVTSDYCDELPDAADVVRVIH